MELREQKGLEIAAKAKLTRQGDRWFVPSQSRGGTNHGGQYIVKPDGTVKFFGAKVLPFDPKITSELN